MKRTFYKYTTDDWYPTLKLESQHDTLVQVNIASLSTKPEKFRVSVWGGDDYGLEYDYNSENEAFLCIQRIIKLTNVTKDYLINEEDFRHV